MDFEEDISATAGNGYNVLEESKTRVSLLEVPTKIILCNVPTFLRNEVLKRELESHSQLSGI
ncbi:hypothetical protein Z043_123667, partial [Scleropages formosus]